MFRAPRDHRVLDRAFLQVIEHLIAGDLSLTCDFENFVEIVGIEIGNAPGADFSGTDQLLERRHRLGQWDAAAPVQQVTIETVGFKPGQRTFARGNGAAPRCIAGQHF